ncbi:MAG: cytochrome c biogenesis protein CcsA [Bacteroidia bacterium]|nr:cytochrome c biogenesis protein CcsA [Bacteroidia bacterium]
MEDITYISERTWAGITGHAFLLIAFIAALISSYAYFRAARRPGEDAWLRLGRITWLFHALGVLLAIALLFFMLANHYFEYQYVWQHSSLNMSMNFIFACFWEGQEGSFLLWTFWHVVIAALLIRKGGEWEAPVMSTFMLVQVFLSSMVLGIYILGYKWGSSPFLLVREQPENIGLPWTLMENYLTLPQFADGRGLNPLLQNYWMSIHPPTLFLGFALTLVPFCFAVAALWKKNITGWIAPVLPWTFSGVLVLGLGILMGGAWAYEALSFGGFWAWDPVENASLVPWITLVAGGHILFIMKSRNRNHLLGLFLMIITFVLVLYSTFLTRSGILGESSVHAFTDLGMYWQLLVFLGLFMILGLALLVIRRKEIPKNTGPDDLSSREFWMLAGMVILLLSAFHICFTTSFPVINKISGLTLAGLEPEDYNKWQAGFTIFVGIILAAGKFLKFGHSDWRDLRKKLLWPLIFSLVSTGIIGAFTGWIGQDFHLLWLLLLFSTLFAISGNIAYIFSVLKGKWDHAGAPLAHAGFGMLIAGALISAGRSEVISRSEQDRFSWLGEDFSKGDNVMMALNDTVQLGDYLGVYKGKSADGNKVAFRVDYFHPNGSEAFSLHPYIQLNERMGNSAEPDTRHFLHKDIYTHVMYADLSSLTDTTQLGEYMAPNSEQMAAGDTVAGYNFYLVFEGYEMKPDTAGMSLGKPDILVGARIRIVDFYKQDTLVMPIYYITGDEAHVKEAEIPRLGLKVVMWKIDPNTGKADISFVRKKQERDDFIVLKAVEFPAINLLWTGCLVMAAGTLMAIRRRIRKNKHA